MAALSESNCCLGGWFDIEGSRGEWEGWFRENYDGDTIIHLFASIDQTEPAWAARAETYLRGSANPTLHNQLTDNRLAPIKLETV